MGCLTARSPVPIFELLDLYGRSGHVKGPLRRGHAMLHASRCETVGLYAGDALAAALMFYDAGETDIGCRLVEIAFICVRDGDRAPATILRAARLARLIVADQLQDGPITIRARVRMSHRPGHRLARLIDLEPIREAEGYMIYERTQWAAS